MGKIFWLQSQISLMNGSIDLYQHYRKCVQTKLYSQRSQQLLILQENVLMLKQEQIEK